MGLEGRTSLRNIPNRHRDYYFDEHYFSVIDSPDKAYWLGFIGADGSIARSGLTIKLHSKDSAHLQKFYDAIGHKGSLKYINNGRENGVIIRACSYRMIDDLAQYSIVPNKTNTFIPPELSEALMPHFWRGMVDGDGSFSKHSKSSMWFFNLVGNFKTIEAFRGFMKNHTGKSGSIYKPNGNCHIVTWTGTRLIKNMVKSLRYDEGFISLDRKNLLARKLFEQPTKFDYNNYSIEQINLALNKNNGSKKLAAKSLGIGVSTFYKLLRDNDLFPPIKTRGI